MKKEYKYAQCWVVEDSIHGYIKPFLTIKEAEEFLQYEKGWRKSNSFRITESFDEIMLYCEEYNYNIENYTTIIN